MGSPARRRAAISANRASISAGTSRSPFAITLAAEKPQASASSSLASRGSIPESASARAMFKSAGFLGELSEPLGAIGSEQAGDQLVEIAVEDALDLVERQIDAVIGNASLR